MALIQPSYTLIDNGLYPPKQPRKCQLKRHTLFKVKQSRDACLTFYYVDFIGKGGHKTPILMSVI